jgi:hypothetical protein
LQDLSLHILDVAENSIAAGATEIEIIIDEDTKRNVLLLTIKDNGRGLDAEARAAVLDPFYTTKGKRVGLGLPMLAQSAREADGELTIESEKGQGTMITARFVHDHIDRRPLGDIAETLIALITAGGLDIDILYEHSKDGDGFILDTKEVKQGLQDVPINDPEVLNFLKETIIDGLEELG